MKKRKIAAVICEYNPFHAGHASLLTQLRQAEGEETAIVAIMSGNYTQRGEPALFPKHIRAACAIHGGADLVLELPFPYSCSGAERFANAGVHIAHALGGVDLLFFGSECGDTEALTHLAEKLENPAFLDAFFAASESTNIGCAQKTEVIYRSVYGEKDAYLSLLREPNNLLGVEYIRALMRKNSSIRPLALSRIGMRHDTQDTPCRDAFTAASAARAALLQEQECECHDALSRLPQATVPILRQAMENGQILSSDNKWLSYCLLYYRHCDREKLRLCDSMSGGLGDRICHAAMTCRTPSDFFAALRSKKHTDAYLRRALLYGVFNIERASLNAPPTYTQILAMNARGREVLAYARKHRAIPIFNRPSEINHLPDHEKVSLRADSVYCALLEQPSLPSDLLRYQPYRENT
ncbi:MAG: nucleotidyltransferase family protein [Clostridia bacterium]|nr:nucleotidyltransferase family protein [Clostridia bacterium]